MEPEKLENIAISPNSLKSTLIERIRDEMDHAKTGKPAQIWAKMNSLIEPDMIDALYEASRAGVQIDCVIRGICGLRPGVKGLSENIRVKSIVGRFLEHSRVYYFRNGGKEEYFIGSADLMKRNLDNRVEVLVKVEEPKLCRELKDFLELQSND